MYRAYLLFNYYACTYLPDLFNCLFRNCELQYASYNPIICFLRSIRGRNFAVFGFGLEAHATLTGLTASKVHI